MWRIERLADSDAERAGFTLSKAFFSDRLGGALLRPVL
jgi:hypothetical protein